MAVKLGKLVAASGFDNFGVGTQITGSLCEMNIDMLGNRNFTRSSSLGQSAL